MSDIVIHRLDPADLGQLKPLWLELLAHHVAVSPGALPRPVAPELSWERRRIAYTGWLSHPKAFALIARHVDQLAGYALVSIQGSEVLADTWDSWGEVAELQTLIVSSELRSQGIGAQLLHRAEADARAAKIEAMIIAAVATNDDAVAFYSRHGYTPYLTYLYARLH